MISMFMKWSRAPTYLEGLREQYRQRLRPCPTHSLVHFSVRQTCAECSPCTSPCAELFAISPPSPSRSPIIQGAGVQHQGSGWDMCTGKTTLDKSLGFCKLRDLRRLLPPEPVLLTWNYSLKLHKHHSTPLLFCRRDDVALGVRCQKSWLWIRRLPLVTCHPWVDTALPPS